MKAVIVDLQNRKAAALCEDGTVREISDLGYTPGQTIELPSSETDTEKNSAVCMDTVSAADAHENFAAYAALSRRKRLRHRPFPAQIAAAAAVCILVLGIGAGTAWAMPCGTVQVEDGSSVTYTINWFDYVLEAAADNDAGQEVLDHLDLDRIVHRKIDAAVSQTILQMEQMGTEEASSVRINAETRSAKHEKKLKERLQKAAMKAGDAASPAMDSEDKKPSIDQRDSNTGPGTAPSGTQPQGSPDSDSFPAQPQGGLQNSPLNAQQPGAPAAGTSALPGNSGNSGTPNQGRSDSDPVGARP